MTQPFFITGLPMSRTTWLANLFTTGNVFCFHDLLGTVKDMAQFFRAMGTEAARTGDADSGLLAVYPQVQQTFPAAPWVLIERDFEDAWESLCAYVNGGPWQEKLSCTYELKQAMAQSWGRDRLPIVNNPRCLVVPFESLERVDMIECIWKHCVPGQRFDRRRAMHLQAFNVRPQQERVAIRPWFNIVEEARKLWPTESIP